MFNIDQYISSFSSILGLLVKGVFAYETGSFNIFSTFKVNVLTLVQI